MKKNIRGYKTINTHKSKNFSAYFFLVNGQRYVVTAHWYFMTFSVQSKKYSFSSEELAHEFFENLVSRFN